MIKENSAFKIITHPHFNLLFRKSDGYTATWGATKEEDPDFSPLGPIIADIEISEICHEGCKFCYKANMAKGANMSFETFKAIFHKLPRTLTQIAYGLGSVPTTHYYKEVEVEDANKQMKTIEINGKKYVEITKDEYMQNKSNPKYIERDEDGPEDFRKIVEYCRNNDYQYVVPNVTINGSRMTPEWYDFFAKNMGAVSVSHYDDDRCFDAVKELTDRGMKQVNIHRMVSEETFDECMALIEKVKIDPRLTKLNAVVFLMLKQRGRGKDFNRLTDEHYKIFIDRLFASGISFGFDSCGAARLLKHGVAEDVKKYITPCESTRESCYINVHGKFYPCSFNEEGKGIEVATCKDFIEDVWMYQDTHTWRLKLLENNCECPSYEV
jgi:hypothetical protein